MSKRRLLKDTVLLFAADQPRSRYELLTATREFAVRRRDITRLVQSGFLRPSGKRPGRRGGEVLTFRTSVTGREWLWGRFNVWKARAEYYNSLLEMFGYKTA
jgi:DNA-binding PadR family transcriptional regulator